MGKHFRIFASTLAGDLLTEPFVMCELDHPVDQITTFLTSGSMLLRARHAHCEARRKARQSCTGHRSAPGSLCHFDGCGRHLGRGGARSSRRILHGHGAKRRQHPADRRHDRSVPRGLQPAVLQRIHRIRSERTHGFDLRPRACRGRFGQRHGTREVRARDAGHTFCNAPAGSRQRQRRAGTGFARHSSA